MEIRLKLKPKGPNDTSDSRRNCGTAKRLSGKIFVLAIFVGTTSNPWRVADISRFKNKLLEAESWLKVQGARYNKSVEFFNSYFGSDGRFFDNQIPSGSSDPNSMSYSLKMVEKIGFASKEAFVDWVKSHTDCDQCFAIIFANQKGRSFATSCSNPGAVYQTCNYSLERCTIYRDYDDENRETTTGTIAHEILHLFGAWDLYKLNETDHGRYEKVKQMFPDTVMDQDRGEVSTKKIDEITAWLVGFKDEGKDWYRWFEPGQDSYQ